MEPRLESALAAALGALRRRERTVSELHSWLRDRGLDEDLSAAAIDELIALGELDDERFALAFAADKRDLSGWGSERIEATLRDRGVEPSLAERAAAEERDAALARAADLLLARGERLDEERSRARALSYLTRRGFNYELAYDAVRRAAGSDPA